MPIVRTTPKGNEERFINAQLDRIHAAVINALHYIGEAVLNQAKAAGNYKDDTGNLRSSLGYVITCDGKVVDESKPQVVKQGGEGAKRGLEYARSLAGNYPSGYALIVVAGMQYAAFVSHKGYDVLDSSEILAHKITPQILKQLGLK